MSILASTRPRASLSAFRDAGLLLHARQYAAKAKGNSVKQHSKCLLTQSPYPHILKPSVTGLAQPRGSREEKAKK